MAPTDTRPPELPLRRQWPQPKRNSLLIKSRSINGQVKMTPAEGTDYDSAPSRRVSTAE